MFDIEYDKDLDTVNIEVFERKGTYNDTERRFRCVCCKKPICLRGSISSHGHRLICDACYIRYFNSDILEAHEWMREDKTL